MHQRLETWTHVALLMHYVFALMCMQFNSRLALKLTQALRSSMCATTCMYNGYVTGRWQKHDRVKVLPLPNCNSAPLSGSDGKNIVRVKVPN